jgi:RimJ/RimL family protein N-acetyltransferase
MRTYKCLNQQVFESDDYQLVPIRHEDRYKIMQWRNEQIYHLRQSEPLTKEMQDKYFDTVIANLFNQTQPDQILFSFLQKDECIGYGGIVHINWVDRNAELSFLMNTKLEATKFENYWSVFLELIEIVAFEVLDLHKIFTYAIDVRPKLYRILDDAGYEKEATLKEQVFFNGDYKDVILHRKFNLNG